MSVSKKIFFLPVALACIWAASACTSNSADNAGNTSNNTATNHLPQVQVPSFNSDSAYRLVAQAVSFGPRTPGSAAQRNCAAWMTEVLQKQTDTVYVQQVQVKGGDGKMLPCINLIGVINPQATRRILLLTHWDSRPWADNDTQNTDKPILAADDGGSGVGVLLEVARQLRENKLPANLGVDILLVDVEDYGKTEWGENSYCLGTQYWAKNPHVTGYRADFGILLDMVGARNAQFLLEGTSTYFAHDVQKMVWQAANKSGYSSYFLFTPGGEITDDHIFVNQIAKIPTIDIINLVNQPNSVFAPHWHTHNDNMDIIDKNTLKAVGQTLLQIIFETAQQQTPA
jgi:hypothetical protein